MVDRGNCRNRPPQLGADHAAVVLGEESSDQRVVSPLRFCADRPQRLIGRHGAGR